MSAEELDPLVFGQQLKHHRRQRGLTLAELGELVGRPSSYLSQLENGHREPRLSTVNQLAQALGVPVSRLLDTSPPNRRAELEVAFGRIQGEPLYESLRLPFLKPSARLDDLALEHLVALYGTVEQLSQLQPRQSSALATPDIGARDANARTREDMRNRDNYFAEIEAIASEALDSVGYQQGAISERNLADLASRFGFSVARVLDLPASTRSVTDQHKRIIYVPQRNAATVRTARSVIAQTLGHFALGHTDPGSFESYVRQRVEANYFAGAVLAPERAAVRMLMEAKGRDDISVEDLNEVFYISYEMAAHRLTNLITRHLDIPVHFQRSDPEGRLWKAYENDGVPLPAAQDGTIEGQTVCRYWSARAAFDSDDSFATHYQYTETSGGTTYWCATRVESGTVKGDAVTVGTTAEFASYFRGSETANHATSSCPDPRCCRRPAPDKVDKYATRVWPSARDHSQFVSGLPTDTVRFDPYPGVDFNEVYDFLERHGG